MEQAMIDHPPAIAALPASEAAIEIENAHAGRIAEQLRREAAEATVAALTAERDEAHRCWNDVNDIVAKQCVEIAALTAELARMREIESDELRECRDEILALTAENARLKETETAIDYWRRSFRDKEAAQSAALIALEEKWRSLASHYRDICLSVVEDSDTHAFNMRKAAELESRADDLHAARLRGAK